MNIVFGRPPIYDRAVKAFPLAGREVFFCWGDSIYVVGTARPPGPHIVAHERVHSQQQHRFISSESLDTKAGLWWDAYLTDPKFRLAQEIPAHAAELAVKMQYGGRNERRSAIAVTAAKLASPMYGGLISTAEAKKQLLAHVDEHALSASGMAM